MPIKVNETSAAVEAMQPDLQKVRALMGGTKAMRKAGELYLPRWPMEDQQGYAFRLKTSTLYNAFSRTVNNMASKPFTEPVKWTDIDPIVEAWFDNIDLQGHNLHTFAHTTFKQGLQDGLTHVLVEYPRTVKDGQSIAPTLADERNLGLRPYVVHINQSQILGWLSETVNGVEVLSQIRIMECVDVIDGEYGAKQIEQVRVLTPGAWQTFRKVESVDKDTNWALYEEGTNSLDFIPLKTYYANQTGFMAAEPPLLDLADLNIKHWQSTSDQDSILHTARVPILAITGVTEDDKIIIGGKSALMLPIGAEAKFVEHSGAAIEAGRNSILDLEAQMESMGAELLIAQPGDKSATEAALDTAQEQSQLASMAASLEDFLDEVVDVMAKWANLPDQGDIDVFDDFSSIGVNAQTVQPFVTSLVTLVNTGLLSPESAFLELQRYGITNPDMEWEAEQEKIQASPPMLGMTNPQPLPA